MKWAQTGSFRACVCLNLYTCLVCNADSLAEHIIIIKLSSAVGNQWKRCAADLLRIRPPVDGCDYFGFCLHKLQYLFWMTCYYCLEALLVLTVIQCRDFQYIHMNFFFFNCKMETNPMYKTTPLYFITMRLYHFIL